MCSIVIIYSFMFIIDLIENYAGEVIELYPKWVGNMWGWSGGCVIWLNKVLMIGVDLNRQYQMIICNKWRERQKRKQLLI